MSVGTINLNQSVTPDPSFKDTMNLFKRQILLDFNCHHLATIEAFNSTSQTVICTINYQQTFFQTNALGVYGPTAVAYPIVVECPVIILQGGLAVVNMPIIIGDQCMLLFNDRDIDNWYIGSYTSQNNTPRLHSFSDAIALVGLNNLESQITNYDGVRAVIMDKLTGTLKCGINPVTNQLTLQNASFKLSTLLENLCSQLESLCSILENICTATGAITVGTGTFASVSGTSGGPLVPGGVSTVPLNASTITGYISNVAAISTQISAISTEIGVLIE